MDNIYFIHDAATGHLIIYKLPRGKDAEDYCEELSERDGIHDASWGGVFSISINI